jgi:hypothetical protein
VQASVERTAPALVVRDPHVFEFLGFKPRDVMHESDLEKALLANIEEFLVELGRRFCFEARQRRILIRDEHFFVYVACAGGGGCGTGVSNYRGLYSCAQRPGMSTRRAGPLQCGLPIDRRPLRRDRRHLPAIRQSRSAEPALPLQPPHRLQLDFRGFVMSSVQ